MKIEKIEINNYRSIKKQIIEDINNSLIAIGKNNAGKSTILNAIRIFWGEISLESTDFHKENTSLEISINFIIQDNYLESLISDNKIGIKKIPSSKNEYNKIKENTVWSDTEYDVYKKQCDEYLNSENEEKRNNKSFIELWMKALKNKFDIENNMITIRAKSDKSDCKIHYYINNSTKDNKDIINILPKIAYIGDDRNFEEEECGKTKTLTASIFNDILINKIYDRSTTLCKECDKRNCNENCIKIIKEKKVEDLSINELEKMINYKTNEYSKDIKEKISTQFQDNYREDYKIDIQANSSIDKSFVLSTKIYDPMLKKEVELSNVGAGIRSIYILSLLQAYQDIMGRNCIFIMEEPELYLHPQLQKEMAKTLWEISQNNQVIFTTHSPIMLKNFDINDVRMVRLDLDNYETIISSVELQTILDEIGYTSQDLINSEFVLFVEGKDDKEVLQQIILKYYDIDLNRLTIIDTKSCQNIETYATLRFLNKTTLREDFAIIRDADTMNRESVKKSVINKLKENIENDYLDVIEKRIFITKFSSIEGYIIDIDFIVQERIFANEEKLRNQLINKLKEDKAKNQEYFAKQNKKDAERIAEFNSKYDMIMDDPLKGNNLQWLKTNVRGHNLFGYLNAKRIGINKIVSNISDDAFEDIICFLDSIKYFHDRKK